MAEFMLFVKEIRSTNRDKDNRDTNILMHTNDTNNLLVSLVSIRILASILCRELPE